MANKREPAKGFKSVEEKAAWLRGDKVSEPKPKAKTTSKPKGKK